MTDPLPTAAPDPGDPGSLPDVVPPVAPQPVEVAAPATPDVETTVEDAVPDPPAEQTPAPAEPYAAVVDGQNVIVHPDGTVEESVSEVQPAPASEASSTAPGPGPLIPTTTFHDTREVTAAESAGQASPGGRPLNSAAALALSDLEAGISALEGWAGELRSRLAKAVSIAEKDVPLP